MNNKWHTNSDLIRSFDKCEKISKERIEGKSEKSNCEKCERKNGTRNRIAVRSIPLCNKIMIKKIPVWILPLIFHHFWLWIFVYLLLCFRFFFFLFYIRWLRTKSIWTNQIWTEYLHFVISFYSSIIKVKWRTRCSHSIFSSYFFFPFSKWMSKRNRFRSKMAKRTKQMKGKKKIVIKHWCTVDKQQNKWEKEEKRENMRKEEEKDRAKFVVRFSLMSTRHCDDFTNLANVWSEVFKQIKTNDDRKKAKTRNFSIRWQTQLKSKRRKTNETVSMLND